jgi:hypothetical protein
LVFSGEDSFFLEIYWTLHSSSSFGFFTFIFWKVEFHWSFQEWHISLLSFEHGIFLSDPNYSE